MGTAYVPAKWEHTCDRCGRLESTAEDQRAPGWSKVEILTYAMCIKRQHVLCGSCTSFIDNQMRRKEERDAD